MPSTKQNKDQRERNPEKFREDAGLALSLAGGALSGFGSALSAGSAPPPAEESSASNLATYLIPAALVVGGGVVLWRVTR